MTTQWIAVTPQELAYLGAQEDRGGQLVDLLSVGGDWFRSAETRAAGRIAFEYRRETFGLEPDVVGHVAAIAQALLNGANGTMLSVRDRTTQAVVLSVSCGGLLAQLLMVSEWSGVRMTDASTQDDELAEELAAIFPRSASVTRLRGGLDIAPDAFSGELANLTAEFAGKAVFVGTPSAALKDLAS